MSQIDSSREAVIVAAARTPVGKAKRGGLATVRPDELAAAVLSEVLRRAPGLDPAEIDDVILGCAFPEGEQGMNMGRMVGLRAGLPQSVPAETINRFCSSGLQSIAHAAHAVMAGQAGAVLAAGVESMSMVPMTGNKFAPNPFFAADSPEVFTNMGLTAENVAAKYGVSRLDQDASPCSATSGRRGRWRAVSLTRRSPLSRWNWWSLAPVGKRNAAVSPSGVTKGRGRIPAWKRCRSSSPRSKRAAR